VASEKHQQGNNPSHSITSLPRATHSRGFVAVSSLAVVGFDSAHASGKLALCTIETIALPPIRAAG
jgi:hypothetical protein